MNSAARTEQVPAAEVRHRDVVPDPRSGKWLAVTPVVNGDVKVQSRGSTGGRQGYIAFSGDERLNEQIVLDGRMLLGPQ